MKKNIYLFLILNNLIVFAANENIEKSLAPKSWEPNYFGMFLSLFLVIGLIYLTAYVYQKLLKIKVCDSTTDEKNVKIISTTPLGQNKSLHIVKVKDDYILLGATQNSITFIKNLEDYEEDRGYYN